ncbi:unnamed protein product [Diabrotica balteata]|uniref:Translocation protein SEC62 n=1 Tax=Diabrotica balteata TaxID=107213 RepID=A0A9N9T7R6_DIABA|nr:unnamed protein product [Diabrotica balteata]
MAEKKRGKKRKDEYVHPGEEIDDKPTKEEITVAKWMRSNVQIKKTKFANHNVEYFTGARAVDALLNSPFATKDDPLFKTREGIADYLHVMLTHKLFHRARKVPVDEQELKGKKGKKKEKKDDKEKKNVDSGEDEKKKEKEKEKVTDAESSVVEGSKDQKIGSILSQCSCSWLLGIDYCFSCYPFNNILFDMDGINGKTSFVDPSEFDGRRRILRIVLAALYNLE